MVVQILLLFCEPNTRVYQNHLFQKEFSAARGKGIVFSGHAGLGQCVEESGFADVWQSDDSAFETHGEIPEKTKLGRLDVQRALRRLIVSGQ